SISVALYATHCVMNCGNDGDCSGVDIQTCFVTSTVSLHVAVPISFVGVRTSVGSTGTGNYGLHLQRTNGPIGAIPTSYGNSHSGTLALAQMGAYTFTATSGDKLTTRMTTTAGIIWPEVRLYGPDGSNQV